MVVDERGARVVEMAAVGFEEVEEAELVPEPIAIVSCMQVVRLRLLTFVIPYPESDLIPHITSHIDAYLASDQIPQTKALDHPPRSISSFVQVRRGYVDPSGRDVCRLDEVVRRWKGVS